MNKHLVYFLVGSFVVFSAAGVIKFLEIGEDFETVSWGLNLVLYWWGFCVALGTIGAGIYYIGFWFCTSVEWLKWRKKKD